MARTHPGLFISFEGGEGGGKSTQVALLAEHLEEHGRKVILTREPGGTSTAELLRGLLLDGTVDLGPMEQLLLFYAARRNHVDKVILPHLMRGEIVLCDRFHDSTAAYQGAAGGVDQAVIRQIHDLVLGDFRPDLTLLLDLTVEHGFRRIGKRGDAPDRFEDKDVTFHERLRSAFLDIAASEPERVTIVDASQSLESVAEAVRARVAQALAT